MTGLTIIVTREDREALRSALTIAAAAAALGSRVRIHAHERAVAPLLALQATPEDRTRGETPDLAEVLAAARELGVEVIACQTGLSLCGATADALPPGITTGGLVGLLAALGDDRLVTL